jgi:hypothetical protein
MTTTADGDIEKVGIGTEKTAEVSHRRLGRNPPGLESEPERFQCCASSVPGPRSYP